MYMFDSREKRNEHIRRYFETHNLSYQVAMLETGDYMLDGGHITIDRKRNLDEVCHNLMLKKDKARFMAEVKRAAESKLHFVLLIEHGGAIKSIRNVAAWRSRYSKVPGKALMRSLEMLEMAWNVEIVFCEKRQTAKKIVEILGREEHADSGAIESTENGLPTGV